MVPAWINRPFRRCRVSGKREAWLIIPHCALAVVLATATLVLQAQESALPPAPQPGFARLIKGEIDRFRKTYADPGITISMIDDEGGQWDACFGIADRDTGRRVQKDTIFELGSISKLFTCAAVLQLQEQGLVDLDHPLREYIPEFDVPSPFAQGAEAITVRMLMTHHSGLMMDDDPWETTVPERFLYRALLPHLKGKPLLFPPGERMHYSSFGVHLLGLLVERRSGLPFSRYMKEKLLEPLDMPLASFDVLDLPADRLVVPYGYPIVWDAIPKDEIRPGGSLRAPVSEVAHFVAMILAGGDYKGRHVLAPGSVREMTRIQNGGNVLDQGARVALGFMAEPTFLKGSSPDEIPVLFHYGSGRTRSLLVVVPAWKQGLVLSSNDYAVTDAAYDLFSKTRGWYLRALSAEAGQPYQYHRPVPDPVEASLAALGPLAGTYASTHGLKVLTATDTGLVDARGTTYIPLADGRFASESWTFPRVLFRFEGAQVLVTADEYPVDRWERLGSDGTTEPLATWVGGWARDEGGRGPTQIILSERSGRLLVRPVPGPANENVPGILGDPAIVFPLRFLEPGRAEVINGALSGFSGSRLHLEAGPQGPRLILSDGLGQGVYRRLP